MYIFNLQIVAAQNSATKKLKKDIEIIQDIDLFSGVNFPIEKILKSLNISGSLKKQQWENVKTSSIEDGNLISEYGVKWVYTKQTTSLSIEIFRFNNPMSAYGVYSILRPASAQIISGIDSAWISEASAGILVKEEFVRFKFQPSETINNKIIQAANEINKSLINWHLNLPKISEDLEESIPFVVRHLPNEYLNKSNIRYIVGPLGIKQSEVIALTNFDIFPGVEIAVAQYEPSIGFQELIIAEYPNPQQSQFAADKVKKQIEILAKNEQDEQFLKRQGNFVVQAFGVIDIDKTRTIINNIKYDYVVRWVGKKPAKILDPVKEIRNTSDMLTSIFQLIFIGCMAMTGIGIAGGIGYFYWRKRSLQNIFSDGMVGLNLKNPKD